MVKKVLLIKVNVSRYFVILLITSSLILNLIALTYNNPQTDAFCSFLSIPNYINQNLSDNTDFQSETQNKTQDIVN